MSTGAADLMALAEQVLARAKARGADEVTVVVSGGTHVSLTRRAHKVEQATEATTRGLLLSVLAKDRFSSNSTNDLREEALDAFVKRAVEATEYLEEDAFRRLPDAARCGRGVSEAQLDQDDPAWRQRTAAHRDASCERLEQLLWEIGEQKGGGIISCTASVADGRSDSVRVMSNGFADTTSEAWFSAGAEMTLDEGDKRPEGYAYYGTRHLSDLPSEAFIAEECVDTTRERLGSVAIGSGSYPMLLENKMAGRLLGILMGPLSGGALHEGRSCLIGKRGTAIASSLLSITDDPTLPRGLGSRPWDGDALVARPLPILEGGVLANYYISQYYARKLGEEPTTGGRSNWVIPPGQRSFADMAAGLPKVIQVTSFLGGNSNATTGDFSFGIRGLLLEHGKVTASLSEMNVSGNLLRILHQLEEIGNDPWTYGSVRSPSLLFGDVKFSGT